MFMTMLMALVCATRADLLYKLDLQFRIFKHNGVSFTVPQLTKTPNPKKLSLKLFFPAFPQDRTLCPVTYMTTLAGGFLVTNYHDAGRKVSKSNLDRGRKQKNPLRQTAVDAWHG